MDYWTIRAKLFAISDAISALAGDPAVDA